MIDILDILTKNNIPYITKGKNVARGHINIQCPFCGEDDQSKHLGIQIEPYTLYYACWRDIYHSNKDIHKLLDTLGIDLEEDKKSDFNNLLNRSFFNKDNRIYLEEIKKYKYTTSLPKSFIKITDSFLFKYHLDYLQSRGFNNPLALCKEYNFHAEMGGKYSGRVILPVKFNEEVTWTGRSITNNSYRYLSASPEEARTVKYCILNYNILKNIKGKILVINEGPFDSLKINWYTNISIQATCLFSLSFTDFQIKLLHEVCPNFEHVLIGLDPNTISQSLRLSNLLEKFNPLIIKPNKKDFGDMDSEEINSIIKKELE